MADSMPTAANLPSGRPEAPPVDAGDQTWTAYLLDLQGVVCRALGSTLYARLLAATADDVRAGGVAWQVLEPHATRSTDSALALRLMAAVHRLVLSGEAPELAQYYPSVGGDAEPAAAVAAFLRVLGDRADVLRVQVATPCQTNEVGRCAGLVGGFLSAAAETAMPLRLLEIGASGGLNLRWDRYRYSDQTSARCWGDAESPVHLRGHWEVPDDLLGTVIEVASRDGCDPHPIDVLSPEGQLAVAAPVWADQPVRFERLRGALAVAAAVPATVAAQPAIQWLPPHLEQVHAGTATVVYHSVVLQYLDAAERDAVVAAITAAGARATPEAPLYWLRMEPEDLLRAMSVRLTRWPGGDERLLATAGAHGNPVRWRG